MINIELFEGPVGDYCIARNTIKCLLIKMFYKKNFWKYYVQRNDMTDSSLAWDPVISLMKFTLRVVVVQIKIVYASPMFLTVNQTRTLQ